MIRIAHLTSVHSRYDTRIFHKECCSLAKKYETFLIVADGLGDETKNDVTIQDIGAFSNRKERVLNGSKAILNKAINLDASIYHLHDPELIPIGLILKKKYGKIVIFDAHEDLPNQILSKHYIKPLVRKPIASIVKILEDVFCSKFDGIVAATPHIRTKFLKSNKFTVDINNYPKLQEFSNLPSRYKQSNQVCYIGGISDVRGIIEILQAISLTTNSIHLKIAGSFIDSSLEPKIKKMDEWQAIEYLGFIGRDGIKQVLSESAAGLVTLHPTMSYLDSLPVKMFEYMSAGVPIIASDFPLWKSIIDTEECGICINPLEPQEIADAIDFIIMNPKIANKMGQNGRKAIISKYNWSFEETKLFKLYNNLLGG